ncbi:unnamed protein product [Paramecium primaurelia]|uniref:Uncharacterized protein n=1 Tax=Paramecium primaurelia TaxID=5886 RepID=A0A8S1PP71_PARPR|nr:unnamed protein product [Paramecium primaurelia]
MIVFQNKYIILSDSKGSITRISDTNQGKKIESWLIDRSGLRTVISNRNQDTLFTVDNKACIYVIKLLNKKWKISQKIQVKNQIRQINLNNYEGGLIVLGSDGYAWLYTLNRKDQCWEQTYEFFPFFVCLKMCVRGPPPLDQIVFVEPNTIILLRLEYHLYYVDNQGNAEFQELIDLQPEDYNLRKQQQIFCPCKLNDNLELFRININDRQLLIVRDRLKGTLTHAKQNIDFQNQSCLQITDKGEDLLYSDETGFYLITIRASKEIVALIE